MNSMNFAFISENAFWVEHATATKGGTQVKTAPFEYLDMFWKKSVGFCASGPGRLQVPAVVHRSVSTWPVFVGWLLRRRSHDGEPAATVRRRERRALRYSERRAPARLGVAARRLPVLRRAPSPTSTRAQLGCCARQPGGRGPLWRRGPSLYRVSSCG